MWNICVFFCLVFFIWKTSIFICFNDSGKKGNSMFVTAPPILLTTAPATVTTAPGYTLMKAPAMGITALSDTPPCHSYDSTSNCNDSNSHFNDSTLPFAWLNVALPYFWRTFVQILSSFVSLFFRPNKRSLAGVFSS